MKKSSLAVLVSLFFSACCFATSEIREYKDFSQVHSAALEVAQKVRPAQIWMVYDIDNTLLTSTSVLGRSEWFDWQGKLIKEESKSSYRVAATPDDLTAIGTNVFKWSTMEPVEQSTIIAVNDLQNRNMRSMVLTARSPAAIDSSLRELDRNQLYFTQSSRPLKNVVFEPQSISNAKPVIFEEGIMMVTGQDKGLALKELLTGQRVKPKVIIFVDDAYWNIENMAKAFANDPACHVIAVYYTHTKPQVEEFERSPKERWHKEYLEFSNVWGKFQQAS